ncbi:MAG: DegT/DnrJ/EryC1/StrS family aminotransferase [Deltaproteobacteria bacterium]|nr:DegT/DnrJ/EryC1/StrS family aminotransferase [Deltaproteobacteria bacterium]
MRVPLLDLLVQYQGIKEEVLREIERVCDTQSFILGKDVEEIEVDISRYCNASYGIGVASGTDALLLSLMAIGISQGDGVITTPYTFFSTASSIARLGATPIFVDIDPQTYNIDPNRLEVCLKRITVHPGLAPCPTDGRRARSGAGGSRFTVKAIIPVHLFGQCAEMNPILELAKGYGLKVIEDSAQAIGAEYKGRRAGSMGNVGCFSFFPTKNLGGFGDGGMVVTDNQELAEKVRILRVHGSNPKYHHRTIGINSRLDELQAVVLKVKLKYLDRWTARRMENAKRYNRLFEKADLLDKVTLPRVKPYNRHVFNQFVIRVKDRDRLREHLTKEGIGTDVYYPIPLHLQGCFSYLGYREGDFPKAEMCAREVLALPIYPELTEEMQEYVVEKIKGFYEG